MVPTVQEFFRIRYDRLHEQYLRRGQNQWRPRSRFRLIYPDSRLYPQAAIRPNGDVIGSHYYVVKYARDCEADIEMAGAGRADAPSVEVHHLLADELMERFGVRRSEGLCVTLERAEREIFSLELPHRLPRRRVCHVDVIFDSHARMYEDRGRQDWIPLIREWLKDNRLRILGCYRSGGVIGTTSAELRRVKRFLSRL